MARTINFDKDQALKSAMLLFWEKGYANTSIADIEECMQLKRTSIYNTFGNKRKLFQQALMRYLEHILFNLVLALDKGQTVKQSISNILNEVINIHFNPQYPGGCMVALSLLENNQHNEETNLILNNALKELRNTIANRLTLAEVKGESINSKMSKDIANHITALITGLIVMAKANFRKTELRKFIKYSVDSIFD